MGTGAIAPIWIVLPLAMIALVLQAGYLMALWELPPDRMPASRRRVRMATGWLSMFVIPLAAYGFGIATPADPATFAIIWTLVIGLIAVILMLAVLDAVNTMRLHRRASRQLRGEIRSARKEDIESFGRSGGDAP